MQTTQSPLFKRIESDIDNYLSSSIEISEGLFFSQYKLIKRIYRFKNREVVGSKINSDLTYNYYFDIISPRASNEAKNLRFDTKHILFFSKSPRKDFPIVFLSNAALDTWMSNDGEDLKLKSAIEEFVDNGNVGFKKVSGGYELIDPLNTYITNQKAQFVSDTDIIERHEMTASQIKKMTSWDTEIVEEVIKNLGDKSFSATRMTTDIKSTNKRYEIYEFTGEVSELEFKSLKGEEGGDKDVYFLAKVIVAGLNKGGTGEKYVLFAEKLTGDMDDHYIYAHRGKYEGRFWRVGMTELLFDHQVRANEIGNQLARGLDWASRVVFRSKDNRVMQNIRADLDNGDVVFTDDLQQVDLRMHGIDQLIADWNRLLADADSLANSYEVVRGEAAPSGTPFRSSALMDTNAGKLFVLLRQKLTLPYKKVFKQWVLPELIRFLRKETIFRFVNDENIVDELRKVMVDSWYIDNLVKIGPHTADVGKALKEAKLEEIKNSDPVIENVNEIWQKAENRLFVTITGENSDVADNVQDMIELLKIEQDPNRIAFLLDTIYKIRGIPVPPQVSPQALQEVNPMQDEQSLVGTKTPNTI